MNMLKLNDAFRDRLDRLSDKVGDLSYLGTDLSEYDDSPTVAIVGTRKPTPYGKLMTERLAEGLAREGVVIVSGLALGIDGIAHSACMQAGGKTIAVIASGLNHIGPVTNKQIADRIIETGGTIISEYKADYKPQKFEFLSRNRIVVALSDAVIIPEASEKSGSRNSAERALKMGIPLFVVPGNVTSPMSAGTNFLLKNGAHAVTEASDVLKILGIDRNNQQLKLDLAGETPEETLILQKISQGISMSHELQSETKLSTIDYQTATTMLEVQGRIAQDSLGNWRLK